jgi:hypothetical protein
MLGTMNRDLVHGKEMFGRAAATAELDEPNATPRAQLMSAYLNVVDCRRRHFTLGDDYRDFSSWLTAVQGSFASPADAIATMTVRRCQHFASRLVAIASRVAAR